MFCILVLYTHTHTHTHTHKHTNTIIFIFIVTRPIIIIPLFSGLSKDLKVSSLKYFLLFALLHSPRVSKSRAAPPGVKHCQASRWWSWTRSLRLCYRRCRSSGRLLWSACQRASCTSPFKTVSLLYTRFSLMRQRYRQQVLECAPCHLPNLPTLSLIKNLCLVIVRVYTKQMSFQIIPNVTVPKTNNV